MIDSSCLVHAELWFVLHRESWRAYENLANNTQTHIPPSRLTRHYQRPLLVKAITPESKFNFNEEVAFTWHFHVAWPFHSCVMRLFALEPLQHRKTFFPFSQVCPGVHEEYDGVVSAQECITNSQGPWGFWAQAAWHTKGTDLATYSICQVLMTLNTLICQRRRGMSYCFLLTSVSPYYWLMVFGQYSFV